MFLARRNRNASSIARRMMSADAAAAGAAIAPQRLKDKVAVITGGAGGVGAAAARLFVAQGAKVVVADIREAAGRRLAAELGGAAAAKYIRCDVRVDTDVARAIDVAYDMDGHVDVVFSNAGILGALGPLDATHVGELAMTMEVNLMGNFLAIKHATRVMKPLRRGSIVLTGSVAGVLGGLGPHGYAMCKSGLIGLARSAAVELREFGIRINIVSPDAVPTRFLASALETVSGEPISDESAVSIVREQSMLPDRYLTAEDVAQAALFLASDEAGYISGHNLVIDGSSTVSKPADAHNWFTQYSPMVREDGNRGITSSSSSS